MYWYMSVELGEDAVTLGGSGPALRGSRPPLPPRPSTLNKGILIVGVVQVGRIQPLRLPPLRQYLYFSTSKASKGSTSGGSPLYARAEERVRRGTRRSRSRARAAASFMKCSTRCSVGPAAVLPSRGVVTLGGTEPPGGASEPSSSPSPSARREAAGRGAWARLLRPPHDHCPSVFPPSASAFVLLY